MDKLKEKIDNIKGNDDEVRDKKNGDKKKKNDKKMLVEKNIHPN